MKRYLLIISLTGFSSLLRAQQYNTALGIKSDITTYDAPSAEVSLKHFFNGSPNAMEVNLGGSFQYIWVQALYERNYILSKDLDWYWGIGADAGHWNYGNGGRAENPMDTGYWTGINGTLGIEYTFNVVPINLALDTGPSLRLVPEVDFGWMAGFAIRYAFR